MSNIQKDAPCLKTILARVRELAAQSAQVAAAKSPKANASGIVSKRLKLDDSISNCLSASSASDHHATASSSADKSADSSRSAVTITFGDCAENHAGAGLPHCLHPVPPYICTSMTSARSGMQKLGETMAAGCGFTIDELHAAERVFAAAGATVGSVVACMRCPASCMRCSASCLLPAKLSHPAVRSD